MNRYVLLGLFWFLVGHIAVFFQLNGQFKWEWFKENTFLLALFGIPISYFYIWGTKYAVEGFDGLLWPARFLGFGVGMVVYAIMVAKFFNEGITPKVQVSLVFYLLLGVQYYGNDNRKRTLATL